MHRSVPARVGSLVVLVSCCVALAPAVTTQGVLYGDLRDPSTLRIAPMVSAVGDADLDGIGDFLVQREGALHLISGRDGALRRSFTGALLRPASGPVGDMDGDGAADVFVIDGERVDVFAGASARLLYSITPGRPGTYFPVSVAGLDDVDGDAVPDMIAMTDGASGEVDFHLISGRSGATISTWNHRASWLSNRRVRSVGDVDGDGARDWAAAYVGVAGWDARVEIWSTRSRSVLFTDPAYQASDAGDVDGDGRDDVLLNVYSRAFLGRQTELRGVAGTIHTFPSGHAGGVSAGDVDGDGVHDVVIATRSSSGELEFYSGRTFGLLSREPHGLRTPAVDQIGDLDGDGRTELLVRGYVASPQGSRYWTRVRSSFAFDLDPDVTGVEVGSPWSTQTLDLRAPPTLGGQLYWMLGSLSGTRPGIPLGPVVLPLRFDGYTSWTAARPASGLLDAPIGVLSTTGTASVRFVAPALPVLAGVTFHHAYVVLGPGLVPTYASRPAPLAILP